MKRAVVLGSIFVGICIALYAGAADELVFFVISGRIPFTNIVISPFGMIAFWLLVIPVSTLLFPAFRRHFWTTIESIGQMSQRRINRSLPAKHFNVGTCGLRSKQVFVVRLAY